MRVQIPRGVRSGGLDSSSNSFSACSPSMTIGAVLIPFGRLFSIIFTLYFLSWSREAELNHRPHAYQACTLTTELPREKKKKAASV